MTLKVGDLVAMTEQLKLSLLHCCDSCKSEIFDVGEVLVVEYHNIRVATVLPVQNAGETGWYAHHTLTKIS